MRTNVSIAKMERLNATIFSYTHELDYLAARLKNLNSDIYPNSYGSSTQSIKNKIEDFRRLVKKESDIVKTMAVTLEKATVVYRNKEQEAIGLIAQTGDSKKA